MVECLLRLVMRINDVACVRHEETFRFRACGFVECGNGGSCLVVWKIALAEAERIVMLADHDIDWAGEVGRRREYAADRQLLTNGVRLLGRQLVVKYWRNGWISCNRSEKGETYWLDRSMDSERTAIDTQ